MPTEQRHDVCPATTQILQRTPLKIHPTSTSPPGLVRLHSAYSKTLCSTMATGRTTAASHSQLLAELHVNQCPAEVLASCCRDDISITMLQGCPCNTQTLCEADRMGNFGQGCHWNSNTPGYWYFGHGGQYSLYTPASHLYSSCTLNIHKRLLRT